MKKLNSLDITILTVLILTLVLGSIVFARLNVYGNQEKQITLNMTEDFESAKYIKKGDGIYLEDTYLGDVVSVKSLKEGGIAITVSATVKEIGGLYWVDGIRLKLGKEYAFKNKRIIGNAICEAIDGGN